MMHQQPGDAENILQECLDQVLNGVETLDSVLTRHPELEDALRDRLEVAIWLRSARQEFGTRPGYVRASRRRLVDQIKQEIAAAELETASVESKPASSQSRWARWKASWSRPQLVMRFAMVMLLVSCLLISSSGAVLAAQSSLPGDLLYPVKISQEDILLSISGSAERSAQLNSRYAQQRLNEMEELVLEGRYEALPETAVRYQQQVGSALRSLRELGPQDPNKTRLLAAALEQTISDHVTILALLEETVPENARAPVKLAVEVSNQGVTEVQALTAELPAGSAPGAPDASETPLASQTPTPGDPQEGVLDPSQTPAASATPGVPSTATGIPVTTPTTEPISGTLIPEALPEGTATKETKLTKTPKPTKSHTPPGKTRQPTKDKEDSDSDKKPKPTKKP